MRRVLIRRLIGLPVAGWSASACAAGVNGVDMSQVLMSLLLVLFLIVGLGWLLRGRTRPLRSGAGQPLAVRAQLLLGARDRILLVQVGEEQILVGAGPGGLRTLHVLPRPLSADSAGVSQSGSFVQRLRAAVQRDGDQS